MLPRVRRTDSPLLVVLSGSTGAGKSTLVNTLVGARVSATGVLRPTTSSPILVCHPDDADWWLDERYVLPGFGRVPGPAPDAVVGDQLVIMKSDVLPKGLALLDSPDVDSVFEDHHEFAAEFLAAADIWMCVTTAARYADAQVWRLLTAPGTTARHSASCCPACPRAARRSSATSPTCSRTTASERRRSSPSPRPRSPAACCPRRWPRRSTSG